MRPWMLVPIIFCSLIAHAAWSGEDIFIVTSAEPDVVERFAAEELQSYLQRISGTTFPIRSTRSHDGLNFIISGAENDEQLGSDGFILHTSGNNLYFLAKGPRGKLYAVYEFLEKYLGVRWYVSDANDEVVPKRTTGEIIQIVNRGVNERQIPSFIFREVTINLGGPNSLSALGKLRFNAVMTSYTQTDTWRSTTLPELQKRAIDLVIGGHSTYQRFLSPEKYFVEHPEWSIMHEGQRIGKDTLNDTATFCTTNKEALAIFLENLVDYVKKTPEAKFLYPWPSDSARWCACGTCSARSVGDRLLALDTAIVEVVKKVRPDMTVIHFAYGSHMEVPKELRPPKEMAVSLSTWGRNFAYTLEDARTDKKFRDALNGWSAICRETGSPLYIHSKLMRLLGNGFVLMPYSVAQLDMRFRKKLGVSGFDFHRGSYGWWTKGLNDYVIAKLAWNCEADVGAMLDDYFATYWAPVGDQVKEVFRSVEKGLPDRRYWGIHSNPNLFHSNVEGPAKYIPNILRPEVSFRKEQFDQIENYNDNSISILRNALDTIHRLISETSNATILAVRLEKLRIAFEYALLQREAIRLFLELRKACSPGSDTNQEKRLESASCASILAELTTLEKRVESFCTKENREAGVLWDNGQTRLDTLSAWQAACEALPVR